MRVDRSCLTAFPRSALYSTVIVLGLAAVPALGQSDAPRQFAVDDWTHHHLVFSNPSNLPEEQRNKILNDPRYQLQQRKRNHTRQAVEAPRSLFGPISVSSP